MDLNASPLPEDEEETYEQPTENDYSMEEVEERVESSVEIHRREREERRKRMREQLDEPPKRVAPLAHRDSVFQTSISRSYEKSRLPHGWLDCPPYGRVIGRIIPSKVPLGESFNDAVEPGRRYSSKQVLHQQRVLGHDIGLVIDLTNTSRYYPSTDWQSKGIKHLKIPCKGRDAVPDNESVNIFVWEVIQFFNSQKHTKKHILVHCTHGHNRTGFMIVHFLVRSHLMTVTQAVLKFSEARPPGIYKQDYIDSLYTFYHESKPEAVTCPPTPEWKRSSDLDLNGEAIQDDDDDANEASLQEKHVESEVLTNDDVLGDAIPIDQQNVLRYFCLSILMPGRVNQGRGNSQFPGSHPVSLNRDNLQLLRQRYYYATWKADGTRYMMLITYDGCYLVDRNFCFRRVQMRFPSRSVNEDSSEKFHHLTLLDGEMIIDKLPNGKLERRYLAYDLMAVNNQSVSECPFSERWKLLEKEIFEPRNIDRQRRNPIYRYEMEPFRVRRKDFWLLSTVMKLLEVFIPRLSHAADGLIFQGWDDPYVPRTHQGLLKWKYPEMNSVDFLFEVGNGDRLLLYVFDRGTKKLLDGNRIEFRDEYADMDVSILSGKIIECSWDQVEQTWVCMRIRVDKSTPNEFNTYKKVKRSIADNITEEVLLDEISQIIKLPMYTDRMAKVQPQHAHMEKRRREA
ncbi:hypothetical protein QJS10_CPA09g01274 [Acorus calamus]|uniref:mRNA guanylyltransferase n=1 Tax=Acorus calamus TaxID=4465 RepID=A0AAV9E3B3_ACOCL|nr:hypothetical protein QJS10_CPA09g01274 [Acorus calamus]